MLSLTALTKQHDAMKPASYLTTYESIFSPIRDAKIVLLELGVHQGGSINVWNDYFKNSTIVGVDINDRPPAFPDNPRTHFVKGSQADPAVLDAASNYGPFDIIIDDGAHIGRIAKRSYQYLFRNHLRPGGLYLMEDWGAPLTMPNWPDSHPYETPVDTDDRLPSFDYGMVGLIKQIIDQVSLRQVSQDADAVARVSIQPGLAVIRKKA